MRKYVIALLLALMVGAGTMMPRSASALSCVHPRDQLNAYALIVEGKVTKLEPGVVPNESATPAGDRVTLAVSRYFKGEGPAQRVFLFDGIGWEHMNPVGAEIIIGLRLDEETEGYRAGACTMRIHATPTNAFEQEMLTLIHQRYGEGRAPVGMGDAAPTPKGQWFLYGSLAGLVVLIVASRVRRKR